MLMILACVKVQYRLLEERFYMSAIVTKNVPNKIYLQVEQDCDPTNDFNELAEVTWCKDRINKSDLVYRRITSRRQPPRAVRNKKSGK